MYSVESSLSLDYYKIDEEIDYQQLLDSMLRKDHKLHTIE